MLRTPHILYIRLLLYRALPHRRGEGDTGHITNPRHELRRQLRCIRNADMLGQAVITAAQLPLRTATGATSTRACTPARRSANVRRTFLNGIQFSYCPQQLPAMAERSNAHLFEVLIGQVAKDREIDIVLGKALGALGHAELFEPVRNLLHRGASYPRL